MEKQTVFIKRYPSKGDLPKEDGYVFCCDEYGSYISCYFDGKYLFDDDTGIIQNVDYFLEEIELPSEEELN